MTEKTRSGGFKALRCAGLVAFSGLGVAVFLVGGSYLYWQSEKQSDLVSQRSLQELRTRLATLKRERADLQGSEETYKSLIARGAFVSERRLDLIEALAELKARHKLLGLDYEVAPQRALKFATGASYPAVGIMASRVHMRIRAYHDGDLVNFLDEFPRIERGFFPVDRCSIKRVVGAEQRLQAGTAVQPLGATSIGSAGIEAECTLEWITLVDVSKSAGTHVAGDSRRTP
jgi:hypothetical protein